VFFWVPLWVWAINTVNTWYKTTTAIVEIDAHSTCRTVRHTGSISYFVPTKSSAEWSAFRANEPSNIVTNTCCDSSLGWYCWYLANDWQNCNQRCASEWRSCNLNAIRNYSWSHGTNTNCTNVLTDLWVNFSFWTGNWSDSNGCTVNPMYSYAWRNLSSNWSDTSCWSSIAWTQRVCACL